MMIAMKWHILGYMVNTELYFAGDSCSDLNMMQISISIIRYTSNNAAAYLPYLWYMLLNQSIFTYFGLGIALQMVNFLIHLLRNGTNPTPSNANA